MTHLLLSSVSRHFVYTLIASALMGYVSHRHPELAPAATVLLGVIAHALGVQTGKPAAAVDPPAGGSGHGG